MTPVPRAPVASSSISVSPRLNDGVRVDGFRPGAGHQQPHRERQYGSRKITQSQVAAGFSCGTSSDRFRCRARASATTRMRARRCWRELADRVGLTGGFSTALARSPRRRGGHDPGQVAADLAVVIADGGEVISRTTAAWIRTNRSIGHTKGQTHSESVGPVPP